MGEQLDQTVDATAPDGGAPQGTVEELMGNATHWLQVVGEANLPLSREAAENPSPVAARHDEVLRYLGDEVAHGDGQVMLLLSELELGAQRKLAEDPGSDQIDERQARNGQFLLLANAMTGFRDQAPTAPAVPAAPEAPQPPQ